MIHNIIFDMGNVLIYFDRDVFLDRVGLDNPEDRELLKREVYLSLEWSRMDRGSLTDEEAAEIIASRVPERDSSGSGNGRTGTRVEKKWLWHLSPF